MPERLGERENGNMPVLSEVRAVCVVTHHRKRPWYLSDYEVRRMYQHLRTPDTQRVEPSATHPESLQGNPQTPGELNASLHIQSRDVQPGGRVRGRERPPRGT